MKLLTFCFAIIFYSSAYAQQSTPFNPISDRQTVSFKAMTLPYLIGNGGGLANMCGVDIGFLKRHALGMELFYNISADGDDMITDKLGQKHDIGNFSCANERGFIVNYKYFFGLVNLRSRLGVAPYVSPFIRIGHIERYKDWNFDNDYYYQKEKQQSYGLLIGTYYNFKSVEHLGIDCGIGGFYKTKQISTLSLNDGATLWKHNEKGNYGLRITISINYWLNW